MKKVTRLIFLNMIFMGVITSSSAMMEDLDDLRLRLRYAAEAHHRMYQRCEGQVVQAVQFEKAALQIYHSSTGEVHWVDSAVTPIDQHWMSALRPVSEKKPSVKDCKTCEECMKARDAAARAQALDEQIVKLSQTKETARPAEATVLPK